MNTLIISLIITFMFITTKYFHTKFIAKNDIIIKNLLVDGTLVFFTSFITIYLLDKYNLDDLIDSKKNLQAFINKPDF